MGNATDWMKFFFEDRPDKVVLKIYDEDDEEKIVGFVAIYSIKRGDRALFTIFMPPTGGTVDTLEEFGREAIMALLFKGFEEFDLKIVYTNVATSLEDLVKLHLSLGFKPLPQNKQMDKKTPQRVISLCMSYNDWQTATINHDCVE